MDKSPWEASGSLRSQEINQILWSQEVYCRFHKSPPLVPVFSQMNPLHALPSYLFKTHFNIIHPSTTGSLNLCLSFRFSHQNALFISVIWHTSYISCPSSPHHFIPTVHTWHECDNEGSRKVKGKVRPITRHEGSREGLNCSSTLSLTSALGGGEWLTPRPGRFTPGKETRCPLYRRLNGSQGWSRRVRKIFSLQGFDPRTVQSVASRYTEWAIEALSFLQPPVASSETIPSCNVEAGWWCWCIEVTCSAGGQCR